MAEDAGAGMSEYTPTTQQVRDGYRYDSEAEYHDPVTPHHVINGRAFDRWYSAEIAKAKADALLLAAERFEKSDKLFPGMTISDACRLLRSFADGYNSGRQ